MATPKTKALCPHQPGALGKNRADAALVSCPGRRAAVGTTTPACLLLYEMPKESPAACPAGPKCPRAVLSRPSAVSDLVTSAGGEGELPLQLPSKIANYIRETDLELVAVSDSAGPGERVTASR